MMIIQHRIENVAGWEPVLGSDAAEDLLLFIEDVYACIGRYQERVGVIGDDIRNKAAADGLPVTLFIQPGMCKSVLPHIKSEESLCIIAGPQDTVFVDVEATDIAYR